MINKKQHPLGQIHRKGRENCLPPSEITEAVQQQEAYTTVVHNPCRKKSIQIRTQNLMRSLVLMN